MIHYRPFELHCHTRHSDGQFTVPGLLHGAAAYGYEGIALTDHNTSAGFREVTPEMEHSDCRVIPGIEWTTFFGHLLVLGCNRFVDWRFVTPDTIDQALLEIRNAGGTAGIAHPCEVGAPLMCGCNWEFHVTRWDLVDYVEVWSDPDPWSRSKNTLALPWYDALLNAGHHLALSAGRDWHGPDRPGEIPLLTATYLGIEGELDTKTALAALRAGRTFVTLGPTLALAVRGDGGCRSLGESVEPGEAEVRVTVGETDRREIWETHQVRVQSIRLVHNGETVAEMPYTGNPAAVVLNLKTGWLRAELHGSYQNNSRTEEAPIALSSPVYIR